MVKRVGFVILLFLLATGWWLWERGGETAVSPTTTTSSFLPLLTDDGNANPFARATEPNAVQFPRDLGAHEDYQTEWWYYTGNLETADKRPFGFQFTIFRRALTAEATDTASDWRTNQVYLAHFTVSDGENGRFYERERFSRGAAGLAGAQAEPYRVWLEDWSVAETVAGQVRLQAKTEEVAIDLLLNQTLPPVLQGDGGLSQKGSEPGNASYYYSIAQQQVRGTVTLPEGTVEVTGVAWKDHEYSTNALTADAVGWDWFSLQFDNGAALMLVQIRRQDGSLTFVPDGIFVQPDGSTQLVAAGSWELEVLDHWTSEASGATYPMGWRLWVRELGLDVEGRPLMPNQELTGTTVYWEGAVQFNGTLDGRPITAKGYIEMTGYAGSMVGRI